MEVFITKDVREVQSFEKCRACRGLRKVLRESVPADPAVCLRCLGTGGTWIIQGTGGYFKECGACGGIGKRNPGLNGQSAGKV
jgi:DnaJ-class molecular chaperone